jgi:hypothetical protein
VIVIEDFYDDFAVACQQIIARTFPPGDKMNKALLRVPSDTAVSPMFLGSMPIAKTTSY